MASSAASLARRRASSRLSTAVFDSPTAFSIAVRSSPGISPRMAALGTSAIAGAAKHARAPEAARAKRNRDNVLPKSPRPDFGFNEAQAPRHGGFSPPALAPSP